MNASVITGVRTVSIPVDDQDRALHFYVDTLGFSVLRDTPIPTGRWIELAPGGDNVVLTLEQATPGLTRGGAIGIRFTTTDADQAHRTLTDAGVDTDEVLHWPGVPPMFGFRDPDGNAFSVTQS